MTDRRNIKKKSGEERYLKQKSNNILLTYTSYTYYITYSLKEEKKNGFLINV